jgi:hypothetical protein
LIAVDLLATAELTDEEAPVRFAPRVQLTKMEAFELCETCALAERDLSRAGISATALRLSQMFDLLESRMLIG